MSRDDHTNANNDGEDNSNEQSWDKSWENWNNSSGDKHSGNNPSGDDAPTPYGPTSHPEDAPGGFQGYNNGYNSGQGSGQGYGEPYPYQNSYQGYGASQQQGGGLLEPGSGKVDLMRAIRFGFKATFANPVVWILGTVVLGLAVVILSGIGGYLAYSLDPTAASATSGISTGEIIINVISAVVGFAISICVMRGALLTVDGNKVRYADFFRPINVGQTVILMIVLGVIGGIVGIAVTMLTGEMVVVDETVSAVEVNNGALGMFFILFFLLFLINPLYSYWIYYTADGHHTAGSAARTGFKDALRNYPMLLLYSFVSGIVTAIIGVITLGLALVILVPALMLATVHIYRQMSGGNIPVEQA
ncbi:hypothetical protein N24_1997 [Corynebacterium suranareeae]|uniref:Uncharacterized protein n=1 Tax=Corynebacterium suranareeae TaxID=2506452 RepID=A0A160PQJ3_9CORY|nr:hypothetical protein [Corynebacterium suranareeae]BAU96259.1 hypothetical protein N24_1997 [Corynebacterium suranareeae]